MAPNRQMPNHVASAAVVELVVSPDAIIGSAPDDVRVSFPPLAAIKPSDITTSFCCHVHFLAGAQAAESWQAARPDSQMLDLEAAFVFGQHAAAPLTLRRGQVELTLRNRRPLTARHVNDHPCP
jgi:hypothetical protein